MNEKELSLFQQQLKKLLDSNYTDDPKKTGGGMFTLNKVPHAELAIAMDDFRKALNEGAGVPTTNEPEIIVVDRDYLGNLAASIVIKLEAAINGYHKPNHAYYNDLGLINALANSLAAIRELG